MEKIDYSGRSVLVTGASGYIGQSLIEKLLKLDCKITALVEKGQTLPFDGVEPVIGDITHADGWASWLQGKDVVFHLAAQTSHYIANEKPLEDWKINVAPILYMTDACFKKKFAPRIVYASSATVAGLPKDLPVDESTIDPLTMYDIHKFTAEKYLAFYSNLGFGMSSAALRLANVYGTSRAKTRDDRGIMNQIAKKALGGEPLSVYGSGNWLRDYVHLDDVTDGFLAAGNPKNSRVASGSFNICTGVGTKFVDVVHMVRDQAQKLTGKKSEIGYVEKKLLPIDERNYIGINSAFQEATGWKPKVELSAGLARLVRELNG